MSQQTSETTTNTKRVPHIQTLNQAAKMAIELDRPILLDYYDVKARIVKTAQKDTLLYKSNEEYTSPIAKLFKVDKSEQQTGGGSICDLIALSENSIYIVTSDVIKSQ